MESTGLINVTTAGSLGHKKKGNDRAIVGWISRFDELHFPFRLDRRTETVRGFNRAPFLLKEQSG